MDAIGVEGEPVPRRWLLALWLAVGRRHQAAPLYKPITGQTIDGMQSGPWQTPLRGSASDLEFKRTVGDARSAGFELQLDEAIEFVHCSLPSTRGGRARARHGLKLFLRFASRRVLCEDQGLEHDGREEEYGFPPVTPPRLRSGQSFGPSRQRISTPKGNRRLQ